jgi:small subunit ribosomal protein S6
MTKNRLYEGMFLIDSALADSNWDAVNNTIKTILEKAEAEIVSIKKWDDRKLAYEIRGKSRGTYILCYFRADVGKIRDIEKAVQLSEQIIRVLILNAEQMTPEDMNKDTPAAEAEQEKGPVEKIQETEEEQPDDDRQNSPEEDSEPIDEVEQDIIEDEDEPEPRE